jgi:hypothetical protein
MGKVGSFLPHPPRACARHRAPHWSDVTLAGMLPLLVSAFAVGALVAGVGCAGPVRDAAVVTAIEPAEAYNDATFRIALMGSKLRPPLEIDTHSGSASAGSAPFSIILQPLAPAGDRRAVQATNVEWISATEIHAGVPAGVLPGSYQVGVSNARGEAIDSRAVFESLGPDNDPPRITFQRPAAGATVSPNTGVLVEALVDDGDGHIPNGHWSASSPTLGAMSDDCTIDPGDKTCRFYVAAQIGSAVTEPITIQVQVVDGVGHAASATLQIQVAWGPDISRVSPPSGPTTGGTAITVQGAGYVPGLSQVLIDDIPIGGVVDGDTITAITEPHSPGRAMVSVSNGASDSVGAQLSFSFVAPPTLRLISPTSGPSQDLTKVVVAGNDFTPSTRFFVVQDDGVVVAVAAVEPDDLLPPAPYAMFYTDHLYNLFLGPGTGKIALRAHDDVGGDSELPAAFTYDAPSP